MTNIVVVPAVLVGVCMLLYISQNMRAPVTRTGLFDDSLDDRGRSIRKDGSFSVVDAPDKLFVGKGMLHCSFVDKDHVFNVVYKDREGATYIKRCIVDKFILGRNYELVPDDCKLIKLTTNSAKKIVLDYKPKPRLRLLQRR